MDNKKANVEELKKLLVRSYDEDLTPGEQLMLRKALEHFEALRNEKESLDKLRNLLSDYDPSYDDGFADRVTQRMELEENKDLHMGQFLGIFKRVAISGAAAIVALLISIYYIDGSLATDAIFGIADYSPLTSEFSFFDIQEIE